MNNGDMISNSTGTFKFTPSGMVKCIEHKVVLDATKNHWYFRKVLNPDSKRDNDKYIQRKVPTASGLDYINTFAGISMIQPDFLLNDNGLKVANPQITMIDGMVERIRARMIGLGRSLNGNLTAFDLTFVYSFPAYLIADLYAKWTYWSGSGNNTKRMTSKWGRIVSNEGYVPDPTKKRFPVSAGMFLEVDIQDNALLGIWSKHIEEQKFADRRALSMARRNIIKAMLGITYLDDDASVKVISWPMADNSLDEIKSSIENWKGGNLQIGKEKVEVNKEVREADNEDYESSHDEEVEQDEENSIPQEKPKQEETLDQVKDKLRKIIADSKEKNKGNHAKIITDSLSPLGMKSLADLAKSTNIGDYRSVLNSLTKVMS